MIIVGTYDDWARACRLRGLRGPHPLPGGGGYQFIDDIGVAAIFKTDHPTRGMIFDKFGDVK
jgi:hypothetical protein